MVNSYILRGVTAAALAASVFASQQASADVIEINNFWAGSGNTSISFTGTNWHDGSTVTNLHEGASAGGFKTYDLTTDPNKQNAFQSFCVDIFHNFGFGAQSNDTLRPATVISTSAATDLGRLYTNHHAEIDSTHSSAANESAFQLAVWEIVNEGASGHGGNYNLNSGSFKASGTGSSIAQSWLAELNNKPSASNYSANIWTVNSMISRGKGYAQDLVVFAPVPEPQTYAMMLIGLGLLGMSARRKKQDQL